MTAPAELRRARTTPTAGRPAAHPGRTVHTLDPAALRAARKAAQLSLMDVEPHVGRAASIIARYERGFIDPPGSVLGVLAGLYGVSVADFYRRGAGAALARAATPTTT